MRSREVPVKIRLRAGRVDDDEVVPKMLVNENGSKVLVVVGRAAAAECRPRQFNEGFDMSPAGYMRDFMQYTVHKFSVELRK